MFREQVNTGLTGHCTSEQATDSRQYLVVIVRWRLGSPEKPSALQLSVGPSLYQFEQYLASRPIIKSPGLTRCMSKSSRRFSTNVRI